MIRRNEIDDAVRQRTPELLSVFVFANGRRALELRGTIRNLFGGEHEVVRAGLDGDRQTLGAGGA